MRIIITNSSNEPIYEQIIKQIKTMIIRGELKEGQVLPSIRGLAKDLQVSVITTKRAYDELEKEGFIYVVPGKGSYVAAQNREDIREQKLRIVEDKLSEIVTLSKMLGISYEDVIDILKILFEEE
ncbi:MAG: GntR family transcriptional regulator [Tissierellia bacterium]|nr:GntR family transcriptional regulator [Tissierellia bacterium]